MSMVDNYPRRRDLSRFYSILAKLDASANGMRCLKDCDGRMDWPQRGVYFFFDPKENRTDTGTGRRVIRVGTHALKQGSRTSLWNRLSQHRGQKNTGGGNHRGSIFRLLVGEALINRDRIDCATWGNGNSAPRLIREGELEMEQRVSRYVRGLPFLWLGIDDPAGPDSMRGYIERNSIALLSNYNRTDLDSISDDWLGNHSGREKVRNSGLWNQNHVDENHDPGFLDVLQGLVAGRS